MITVKEIAKMCGVSPSTVSNILNGRSNMSEETKNKVLKVVNETGYKPNYYAQGMRRTNNKTICIIAEELCQFSTPPIVESIMDFAESKGYRTILINMAMYERWKKVNNTLGDDKLLQENATPAFLEAQAVRADGVIYVAAHGRILDCVPADFDSPVIFAYGASKDNKYKSVIINDSESSYEAVNFLVDKGHKKIGVIAGDAENFHTIWRLKGYKDALEKRKLEYNDEYIVYGDWERESGYENARKLIEKKVTAIWCHNDLMAAGAYDYMRDAGLLVGKDVALLGFDNREISEYLYPPLSTSEIMLEQIGIKASELLIEEIENEDFRTKKENPYRVMCKMVLRDSVNGI